MKAERKDAVPIQGGTDVMVTLNFDRARPETILNLNEVAELRGWGRDNGTLRLGSGLTYAEAMNDGLASVLPALAEASRTVGSPQIRNRGTRGRKSGDGFARGRRAAAASGLRGGGRSRVGRAWRARRSRRAVPDGAETERALARRAHRRGARRAARDAADVHEGRAAKRDGDRGGVACAWSSTERRTRSASRTGRRARSRGSSELGWGTCGSWRSWSPAMRLRSTTYGERRRTESMR